MRPVAIPKKICYYLNIQSSKTDIFKSIRDSYKSIFASSPDVSIVIPAYNEEENIHLSIASLCFNKTEKKVEIIIVDNNSFDGTCDIVKACGVKCISEPNQGITFARNTGLKAATGKYILNADADTIYPEKWIDRMIDPLVEDRSIALTYGRFSFIPVGSTNRITCFFYEYLADFLRLANKYIKDEAVNVYGFNSGFRRDEGMLVSGFDHPPGTNEDGYMALKLRNRGLGKLKYVTDIEALVWTTDRRIQLDGGLFKGTIKRLRRFFS